MLAWGIKIYLLEEFTQDTSIGLYTEGGVSYLRWIESTVTGATETWKTGIIGDAGIPAIVENADAIRGGGVALVDSMSLSVNNAAQLWKTLEDAGIYINNKRADIIEIEYNGSTTTETVKYRGVVSVNQWDFEQYGLKIEPAIHNRNANMATVIDSAQYPDATDDLIGETVPITIGKFEDGRYAKFQRVADSELYYDNVRIMDLLLIGSSQAYTFPTTSYFPIVGSIFGDGSDAPPTLYQARIYDSISTSAGYSVAPNYTPDNLYCQVVQYDISTGEDNVTGQYRKVTQIFSPATSSDTDISFSLAEPFINNLVAVTDNDNGTWIRFVEINKKYESDVWPCGGVLDSDGNVTEDRNIELYSYYGKSTTSDNTGEILTEDEKYNKIPPYFLEVDTSSDGNRLSLSQDQLSDNKDEVASYLIQPLKNIYLFQGDLADYGIASNNWVQQSFGVYSEDVGQDFRVTRSTTGTRTDILNTDNTLTYKVKVDSPNTASGTVTKRSAIVFELELPDYPEEFGPDGIHLGIRSKVTHNATFFPTDDSCGVYLMSKKWYTQNERDHLDAAIFGKYTPVTESSISCLPDWYFDGSPSTDYKNDFYFNNDKSGDYYDFITGLSRYEIKNINKETWENVKHLVLMMFMEYPVNAVDVPGYWEWEITNISVVFTKTTSIKKAIYAPFYGRQLNDTFGGRYGATSIIDDLRKYHEHVCRLQNWSETGDTSTVFGKAYSSNALINLARADVAYESLTGTFTVGEVVTTTSGGTFTVKSDTGTSMVLEFNASAAAYFVDDGDTLSGATSLATATISAGGINYNTGGFFSPNTSAVADREVSFQITDQSNAFTHKQKELAAKHGWFTSYVNELGEESIAYLPKASSYAPVDTITLSDVPVGYSIGKVKEPSHNRVYCEPYVRYNYDQGSRKYQGYIAIRNTSAATYSSDYTPGLSGGDGEQLWTRCNTELWDRFRFVQDPPSSRTDLPFFYRYTDAVWYLNNWITWMQLRSVTVPVYYALASSWHVGRHVYLNLPHQTNGTAVECVIDKITKNHTANVCQLNLLLLESVETPDSAYYIQNTMDKVSQGSDADWVDTMTEYGDENDKTNNM